MFLATKNLLLSAKPQFTVQSKNTAQTFVPFAGNSTETQGKWICLCRFG